jgi:A/G-specific adenine glycosylase
LPPIAANAPRNLLCRLPHAFSPSRPAPARRSRALPWQRTHGRHGLPWQGTRDAYRIWLAEIMLQQTQVATVVPYYARFLAAFPDARALAAAPVDRVLELWSGLGYYRRAHHLHAAAEVIVRLYDGHFPRDARTIATLPGIGRSTAAAIAAFAFGERGAILDGNVKRVLARHRGIDGFPGAPKVEARLWELAESLLPERGIGTYTQALMDLGATLCTRSAPRCGECPVATDCVARFEGRIADLPAPRPARARPARAVRVLVLEHAGTILLEKRPAAGIWAGLWSLPEIDPDADIARHCKHDSSPACVGDRCPDRARLRSPDDSSAARRRAPVASARGSSGTALAHARRCACGGVARANQEVAGGALMETGDRPQFHRAGFAFGGQRFGAMPRRSSASRSRNSISAFTLRSSACARRSMAAHTPGSTRSRNAFLSAMDGCGTEI